MLFNLVKHLSHQTCATRVWVCLEFHVSTTLLVLENRFHSPISMGTTPWNTNNRTVCEWDDPDLIKRRNYHILQFSQCKRLFISWYDKIKSLLEWLGVDYQFTQIMKKPVWALMGYIFPISSFKTIPFRIVRWKYHWTSHWFYTPFHYEDNLWIADNYSCLLPIFNEES